MAFLFAALIGDALSVVVRKGRAWEGGEGGLGRDNGILDTTDEGRYRQNDVAPAS